jgi:predicted homoserine dehydrogenase-like protein
MAKHDLKPGDVLDAIGGTAYYSLVDTYETARAERLLPIGLAKGARVIGDIPVDQPITLDDIELKPSTVLELRKLQDQWFAGKLSDDELEKAINGLALE